MIFLPLFGGVTDTHTWLALYIDKYEKHIHVTINLVMTWCLELHCMSGYIYCEAMFDEFP